MQKKVWYVMVNGKETRVDHAIYRPAYEIAVVTLPKIQDPPELIREAEHVLSKANEYMEKMS